MAPMAGADERIGSELAGYHLESVLGRGGIGVVYLARDPWLDRRVALKLLAPELSENERFRERFLREQKLAASLEHANVVPIYEAGEADGLLYLAMRYVAGADLKTLIRSEVRVAPARTLWILQQIAVALDAAHDKGLVHRDVKPGNILLSAESEGERAYLSDFGLTKRTADRDDLGDAGHLVGTLEYIAPEQIQGDSVAAQTDIYSLGCVLYECLTGSVPYAHDSKMALLWAHLKDDPPRPSEGGLELPEGLDAVVATALAKSPRDRYASCEQLIEAARTHLDLASDITPGRAFSRNGGTTGSATVTRNPYKGLRPFGEADANDFFGRDALVEELLARLGQPEHRLLAVVGTSGSGKSSVIGAGLVPRLAAGALPGSEKWMVVDTYPASDPMAELESAILSTPLDDPAAVIAELRSGPDGLVRAADRALPDADSQLLVIIDQFEELFTLVQDDDVRTEFVDLLSRAASEPRTRVRLVLTLRADFYDRPLRYAEFSQLLEKGLVTVRPLAPEELERAIAAPAERAGVVIEPGLVADIVADVTDQPGALPLLQFTLTELFDAREGDAITASDYRAIGGVSGALAKGAEDLYETLDPRSQDLARRFFTRLVSLGEGTEDTRRRILRSEVEAIEGASEGIDHLIDLYGTHRLLSFDRDPSTHSPTVKIAHEALLREWPRLRNWIDDDREGLRLHRHLSSAATAWDKLGRDDGELYRGARLEQALAWLPGHSSELNPLENQFVEASRELELAERHAERERTQQRIRQNRRLRIALAVVAVALAGAIAGAVVAIDQRSEANNQAERASAEAERANEEANRATAEAARADEQALVAQDEAQRAEDEAVRANESAQREADARFSAETERLIAVSAAQVQENRRVSLLLAAEARRRDPSIDALSGLQRALTGSLDFLGFFGEGPDYQSVALTGHGRLVIGGTAAIESYDVESGELIRRVELPAGVLHTVLAPDGELAVVVTETEGMSMFDTQTGDQLLASIGLALERPTGVALSRDLAHMASTHLDGTMIIWNATSGDRLHTIDAGVVVPAERAAGLLVPLTFSRDGSLLASGSAPLFVSADPARSAPASPGVRLWDVASGQQVGAEMAANPPVEPGTDRGGDELFGMSGLAFSEDARTLTTVGRWTVRRWDLPTGELLSDFLIPGVADYLVQAINGFTQVSDTLAVGLTPGGVISVFDLRTGELASELIDSQLTGVAVAAAADSSAFAVAGQDGTGLWSTSGRQLLGDALATGGADHATFNADTTRLVTTKVGEQPIAWDLEAEPPRARRFGTVGWTWYLDRGQVLVNHDFSTFPEIHFGTNDPVTLADHQVTFEDGPTLFLEAAHAGRGLAYSSSGPGAVFDLKTGELLTELGTTQIQGVGFNLDGTRLATHTEDGGIVVYDTDTWDLAMGPTAPGDAPITIVEYSPNDRFLLAGDSTGTITLLDPESLAPIGAPLIGHRSQLGPAFLAVFFGPDNRRLVTKAEDELAFWDLETRQQIGDFWPGERGGGSPDGRFAVSFLDEDVIIWDIDTDNWFDTACRAAGRNMTQEEWERFGPKDEEYRATCSNYGLPG